MSDQKFLQELEKKLWTAADKLRSTLDAAEIVVDEQCIIPLDELSDKFHQITGPLFDQILANREVFEVLATLRDTLLPKLLSGELSVGSQEVASVMETAV